MTIAERIKERRKELGYNADYVAEQLGVSRSTIFRYENGDIEKIPVDIVEKLANILKTTPDFLMGRADSPIMQPSTVDSANLFFRFDTTDLTETEKLEFQEQLDAFADFLTDSIKKRRPKK